MSKHKNRQWSQPQPINTNTTELQPPDDQGDGEDAPETRLIDGQIIDGREGDNLPPIDPKSLAAGQIYDGVIVPDRDINVMQLPPGYTLPAIVLESPYTQGGKDWWIACILGESCTKVYVDAKMLATGVRRE